MIAEWRISVLSAYICSRVEHDHFFALDTSNKVGSPDEPGHDGHTVVVPETSGDYRRLRARSAWPCPQQCAQSDVDRDEYHQLEGWRFPCDRKTTRRTSGEFLVFLYQCGHPDDAGHAGQCERSRTRDDDVRQ